MDYWSSVFFFFLSNMLFNCILIKSLGGTQWIVYPLWKQRHNRKVATSLVLSICSGHNLDTSGGSETGFMLTNPISWTQGRHFPTYLEVILDQMIWFWPLGCGVEVTVLCFQSWFCNILGNFPFFFSLLLVAMRSCVEDQGPLGWKFLSQYWRRATGHYPTCARCGWTRNGHLQCETIEIPGSVTSFIVV